MKKIVMTLGLAGILLIFTGYSSWAVEKNTPASTNSATSIPEFKNPEKSENLVKAKKLTFREKFKLFRQVRKEMRRAKKAGEEIPMVLLYVLAVLLPWLAVGLYTNWGIETVWAVLLWLCFWIPGIIYAFYILLR